VPLLIESVQPQLVGGVDSLLARLTAEGQARGLSKDQSDAVIAMLPPNLAACGCFLDRLTDIWRYEFGSPHRVGNELIWGVHMWPRVPLLFDVLQCAQRRLLSRPRGRLSLKRLWPDSNGDTKEKGQ
jgi:hypothetical protein